MKIRSHLRLLFFLICIATPFLPKASHYYGGTMSYACLAPDSFRVIWTEYYDCAGLPMMSYPNIVFTGIGGSCGAPTGNVATTSFVETDITPLSANFPQSPCQFPVAGVGIKQRTWSRDFKFPANACAKYQVSFSNCCRAGFVQGMNGSSTDYSWRIDTLHVNQTQCNSSPVWNNPPVLKLNVGQSAVFDQRAIDPDSDSLAYRFSAPWALPNTSTVYNIGYSVGSPLGSTWGVSLMQILPGDAFISFNATPGANQSNYITLAVDEFRNGQRINTTYRDMLVSTSNMPCPNSDPSVDTLSSTTNQVAGLDTVYVAPGGNFCVNFHVNDPDPGNGTTITLGSGSPELGSLSLQDTSGTPASSIWGIHPWGRLCGTAPGLPGGTFTQTLLLSDSTCNPLSFVFHSITFIVEDTSAVWPGDANHDFIADYLDIVALGHGFGASGPARPSANNTWTAQYGAPWLDTIPGPVDMHHTDCNGDGTINANDTLPIVLNYGLVHSKRIGAMATTGAGVPLYFVLDEDSADVGDTITASILLGDSLVPATNVYGLAFQLAYDPAAVDSSTFSLDFVPSWFGNPGNTLDLTYNHPLASSCDAAMVRKTHTPVSGYGLVARATIILVDNIDGKRATLDSLLANFIFTNARLFGIDGEDLLVDAYGDSMTVYQLSLGRPVNPGVVAPLAYPNPASELLKIDAPGHALKSIVVNDIMGRQLAVVLGNSESKMELGVEMLPRGIYLLEINSDKGQFVQKVVLE